MTNSKADIRIREYSGLVKPHSSSHRCPIEKCGKSFTELKNLRRHYRNTKEASHQILSEAIGGKICRTCDKKFSRSCNRGRHEKHHSMLVNTNELDDLASPAHRLNSFNSAYDLLISFFVHQLAPSRTLSKAQNLFMELLAISPSFSYLRYSILSLCASYLKHKFNKDAILRWRLGALNELRKRLDYMNHPTQDDLLEMKAILGCSALLLQYAVKDPSLHQEWRTMVRGLGPLLQWAIPFPETLPYRMRLAAHYVLANTATRSSNQFPSAPFLTNDEKDIQEIDGSICASPQMLNAIQDITLVQNKSDAKALVVKIYGLRQVSSEHDIDQEAKDVIEWTAETFQLGALEYANCRYYGIIPVSHMNTIRQRLLEILESLPLHGRLYTAMHNLWGVFFCAVGTPTRNRLKKILHKMADKPETNIDPVLTLIYMTIWKTEAFRWEEIIGQLLPSSLT